MVTLGTTVPPGTKVTWAAACDAGDLALSGGCRLTNGNNDLFDGALTMNDRAPASQANWVCQAVNHDTISLSLATQVTCLEGGSLN